MREVVGAEASAFLSVQFVNMDVLTQQKKIAVTFHREVRKVFAKDEYSLDLSRAAHGIWRIGLIVPIDGVDDDLPQPIWRARVAVIAYSTTLALLTACDNVRVKSWPTYTDLLKLFTGAELDAPKAELVWRPDVS